MTLLHDQNCFCIKCYPKNVTVIVTIDYQEQYVEAAEANKPEAENENDKGATTL